MKGICKLCVARECEKAYKLKPWAKPCEELNKLLHIQFKVESLYKSNGNYKRHHFSIPMKEAGFGEPGGDDESGSNLRIDMKVRRGTGTKTSKSPVGARIMYNALAETPDDYTVTSTSSINDYQSDVYSDFLREWLHRDPSFDQYLKGKRLLREHQITIEREHLEAVKDLRKHLLAALTLKNNKILHWQLRAFYLRYIIGNSFTAIKRFTGEGCGKTFLTSGQIESDRNVRKLLTRAGTRVAHYLYWKVDGKYRSMLSRVVNKRPVFGKYTAVNRSYWNSIDVRYDYPDWVEINGKSYNLKSRILAKYHNENVDPPVIRRPGEKPFWTMARLQAKKVEQRSYIHGMAMKMRPQYWMVKVPLQLDRCRGCQLLHAWTGKTYVAMPKKYKRELNFRESPRRPLGSEVLWPDI